LARDFVKEGGAEKGKGEERGGAPPVQLSGTTKIRWRIRKLEEKCSYFILGERRSGGSASSAKKWKGET